MEKPITVLLNHKNLNVLGINMSDFNNFLDFVIRASVKNAWKKGYLKGLTDALSAIKTSVLDVTSGRVDSEAKQCAEEFVTMFHKQTNGDKNEH